MSEIMTIQGVECYEQDGVAYLNLEAVARGLGFTDTKNDTEYVRWNTVRSYLADLRFSQEVAKDSFIPENIFYRLAMKAKNAVAEQFQAFIADEVIPAIRKHGGYLTPAMVEQALLNPDTLIRLATDLKQEREMRQALEAQAIVDKPKVVFADAVSVSDSTILIGELAKILKGNGIDIGQNRLFEQLRQDGFLVKRKGTDYNTPTQKAMELGLFKVKETAITHSDGHVTVNKTTKVTGRGQQYLINKYKSA